MKDVKGVIAAKYFGWWFAWGSFSAIMVFIVIKGGNMEFHRQLVTIFGIGFIAGLSGCLYYLKRS
jgi:hypothetical protein